MKGKVASKVVDYAVEADGTLFVFSIGVFAGIHWRVILALIKKGEIPEAPKGHCHKFR